MKSNTLKKIGAIALAAVMAVTFAPVASLTAFAGANDLTKDQDYDDTHYVLKDAGTYKAAAGYGGTQALEFDSTKPSGKFVIDLNSKNTEINLQNAVNADVIIKNTGAAATLKLTANYALFSDSAVQDGTAGAKTLSIGEKISTGATPSNTITGINMKGAIGTTPAAKVGAAYWIGNDTISDKAYESGTGADVEANNGAVVVKKLVDTKTAGIENNATPKTTIKATAEDGKSLVQVVTKYTFTYDLKDADGEKIRSGSQTFTDTDYIAGAAAVATAVNFGGKIDNKNKLDSVGAATGLVSKKASTDTVAVTSIVYDRAVTVYQNSKDKFGKSSPDSRIAGFDDSDPDPADWDTDKVKGISYFTQDPSKNIDADANGVALIDGSKYVVYDDGTDVDLSIEAKYASSSVEIAQAIKYNKDDGNKDTAGTVDFPVSDTKVTVKAPKDMSVITAITDNGANGDNKVTKTKNVYIESKDDTESGVDYDDVSDSSAAEKITVEQVTDGSVFTVKNVPDEIRDGNAVAKASGLGYYYVDGVGADDNDYTFGATKTVTDDYVTNAAGSTKDDNKIDAIWTSDEDVIFASKEINTTVKGVAEGVTIKGEVNADVIAKDEEKKTQDWNVNTDQKATETAKMYRFNNTITGEHFYTSDAKEVATLQGAEGKAAGWVDETADKNTYKVLPAESETGVAVYRLFNSIANEHFFTTDKAEANAAVAANVGWKLEGTNGVAFKAAPADTTEEKVTVYRMHRPSDDAHLFTPDSAEVDWLVGLGQGWEKEGTDGIAFYGFK